MSIPGRSAWIRQATEPRSERAGIPARLPVGVDAQRGSVDRVVHLQGDPLMQPVEYPVEHQPLRGSA